MLRRIISPRREPDEDYVSWVRRATRIAEEVATAAGMRCWVRQYLYAKWQWAGHVARMVNYRQDSWAAVATFWRDANWKADYIRGSVLHSCRPLRSRAGRWSRWEDAIHAFCVHTNIENWRLKAQDKGSWSGLADNFVDWARKWFFKWVLSVLGRWGGHQPCFHRPLCDRVTFNLQPSTFECLLSGSEYRKIPGLLQW